MTLRAARVNAGYTMREVCEKTGFQMTTLSSWENGTTLPRIDHAKKLCDLYGCTLNDLRIEKEDK